MKTLSIIRARYVEKLKLELTFSDLTSQLVDFEEFLKKTQLPDLAKYGKSQNFKKFRINAGNLVWGDFEMIFPLEDLYKNQISKGSTKITRTA